MLLLTFNVHRSPLKIVLDVRQLITLHEGKSDGAILHFEQTTYC